jgi:PP-loop superfamily ATP-utilizing enzyme
MPRALAVDMAGRIDEALRDVGFKFVTLDLQGFRSGSLSKTHTGEVPDNSTVEII